MHDELQCYNGQCIDPAGQSAIDTAVCQLAQLFSQLTADLDGIEQLGKLRLLTSHPTSGPDEPEGQCDMVQCDTTLCTKPVGYDAMYNDAAKTDGGDLDLHTSHPASRPDEPEGQGDMVQCDTTLCANPVGCDAMYSDAVKTDGGERELHTSYLASRPGEPEGQGTPLQPHSPSSVGCHASSLCDGKLHVSDDGDEVCGLVESAKVLSLGALCYLGHHLPTAIVNGGDNSVSDVVLPCQGSKVLSPGALCYLGHHQPPAHFYGGDNSIVQHTVYNNLAASDPVPTAGVGGSHCTGSSSADKYNTGPTEPCVMQGAGGQAPQRSDPAGQYAMQGVVGQCDDPAGQYATQGVVGQCDDPADSMQYKVQWGIEQISMP